MGKPQAPQAPNPVQVSQQQTGSNIATAIANGFMGNVNTVGPQGTTTFVETGGKQIDAGADGVFGVPIFTQYNTLSPAEQTKLDQQNQLGISLNNVAQAQTDKIGGILNTPVSAASVQPQMVNSIGSSPSFGQAGLFSPNAGAVQAAIGPQGSIQGSLANSGNIQDSYGPTDYSADRKAVEDALYSRVNPQLDRDRNQLETKLVNQGLARGSTAFNNAMDEANRQANDARMQVVGAGGAEQTRLAGLARDAGNFTNAAQQQRYGQNLGAGQFANTAQQQGYDQSIGAGTFANTAQQQKFDQQQGTQTFNNQTVAQNNDTAQRGFTNTQAAGNFANTARQQGVQELLAFRNQPINEISGLMSGGQVNIPQFQGYNAPTVANTDVSGNYYNSAAINQQNYATKAAQQNALVGGLAGLGGSGLYGLASGGLKKAF